MRLVITSESLTAQRASCAGAGSIGEQSVVATASVLPAALGLRRAVRCAILALGGVTGHRQEHVVERRPVQRQPVGLDAGGIETSHRVDERVRSAVADLQRDAA